MIFKAPLVELPIVEGAEFRRPAAQSPDQTDLGRDDVDDETKARSPRELEPVLGFPLHFAKRISRREQIRVQVVAAIGRKSEVAGVDCGVESAAHQIPSGLDVLRPGDDEIPKSHVGTRLVAMQSALFHQLIPKPAESESGRVVSEVRSENHSKPDIGKTRSIAVTMLEAEVRDPTDDEVAQSFVGEHCRRYDDRENVEGCAPVRIGNLGQVDQFFDRAAPELSPNPLVFLRYVVIRRMRRPLNAGPPEVF